MADDAIRVLIVDDHVDSALRAAERVAAPDGTPTVLPPGVLDTREEQVLRLLAPARSRQEIATELDLSVDAVARLQSSAMKKARLTGRVQVVRYAQAAGWLEQ